METNINSTPQRWTAAILPKDKKSNKHKIKKEETLLLKYGLQYSTEEPATTHLTSLIAETERAIKPFDGKVQDADPILTIKKLKHILDSNHQNFLQKDNSMW
jgi:hypothetical protein